MASISIIFPILNGWRDTKNCLKSIAKLNYPKNKIEVIIINNASTDGSHAKIIEFAKKHSYQFVGETKTTSKKKVMGISPIRINSRKPTLILIKNRINLGFAKAINQGILKANSDYLLITNNDVIFSKDYLKILTKHLKQNKKVGIIGGKIYYKNSQDKISFCGAKFSFYSGLLSLGKTPDRISKTDWLPGCNMLIKKEVINKVGKFDDKYPFYFEDFDFCLNTRIILPSQVLTNCYNTVPKQMGPVT